MVASVDALGEVGGALRPLLIQHLGRQALAAQVAADNDESADLLADMPTPLGPLNKVSTGWRVEDGWDIGSNRCCVGRLLLILLSLFPLGAFQFDKLNNYVSCSCIN